MIAENQSTVIDFMSRPQTRRMAKPVEKIETHISLIFLAGERVYKMKRAIKLPYADFSTASLRLETCEKEVELNSRTAPELYLGVHRITRDKDGKLGFDGDGTLVDAVVEMKRFDQECLLDRMAGAGDLTPRLMEEVATMVAAFHSRAPIVHRGGGAANMASVLDINEKGFATSDIFDQNAVADLNARSRKRLEHHAALLDRRETAGKVRRCHGDLHLRNICMLDGQPRLFDCIEFNERIATTDTLYDLAFLLMDLWHRGLTDFANLAMNRYLDQSGDEDGFVLSPFFMAVRATVRAHVTATQVAESTNGETGELIEAANSYFELARQLLETTPPRLLAVGGLSGSGKSTIAEALAARVGPPPGARVLETDRIRKAMHGVAADTRLPAEAYRSEVSKEVYVRMGGSARRIMASGGTVVADAVFDKPGTRSLIETAASEAGSIFKAFWLEAKPSVLMQRIKDRSGGTSDATVDVLKRQIEEGAGDIEWERIDADQPVEAIVSEILASHN